MTRLLPLLSLLLLVCTAHCAAARPKPMEPTTLPVDRTLSVAVLGPSEVFVLQEDQANVYYLPMPGNYALTASQSFAYGAALGAAASLVTEGIALVKRKNDAKRLARIEQALGKQPWGERLKQAVRDSLSPKGLGTGFDFVTEVARKRVGSKVFDAPGRALGTIEAHVAFTPNFRGVRIFLSARIEDRRVIRNTKLRLEMERLPLREIAIEYLIALPQDEDLGQKERTQRWSEQDPQAFAAGIEAGIAEAVQLLNRYWHRTERGSDGDKLRFRLDGAIQGKGRLLARDAGRVLIAGKRGVLHSVPVELLERGMFD